MFGMSLWKDDQTSLEIQAQEGTKKQGILHLQAWQRAVSVDMMHSPIPGLVAQMAGAFDIQASLLCGCLCGSSILAMVMFTSRRHRLMRRLWKARPHLKGIVKFLVCTVKHYHADNGIFSSKAWKDACEQSRAKFHLLGSQCPLSIWSGWSDAFRELQETARAHLASCSK